MNHQFNSPLARDLFALGAETMIDARLSALHGVSRLRQAEAMEIRAETMNDTPEFRPIATEFTKHGYRFTQIRRVGRHAIYRQHVNGGDADRYEVVRIRLQPASVIQNRPIPARESYPNDEQWGKTAWTCWNLADAEAKLADLVEKDRIREENHTND